MKNRKKIIFLSAKNPYSKKDWSGIVFFMMASLNHFYDVEHLQAPEFVGLKKFGHRVGKLLSFFLKKKYIFDYGKIMSWVYGAYYSRKLRDREDALFLFVPAGLTEISRVKTKIPIVAVGDCSTLQLLDYYPALKNVSSISKKEIESVERTALKKCCKIIFSSDWASSFVTKHFNVAATTIPFGSNIAFRTG
jgi:hypothetical protein